MLPAALLSARVWGRREEQEVKEKEREGVGLLQLFINLRGLWNRTHTHERERLHIPYVEYNLGIGNTWLRIASVSLNINVGTNIGLR